MLIDEQAFKSLVHEAVKEALCNQSSEIYEGFADVERFIEISGISKHDLEEKIFPHPDFKQYVYQPGGRKRYIEVQPAMDSIRKIMREAS
ncbi:hypothetical protein [Salinicoccus albus]|uniref:hypothetical protein n=1 Tax=Salinicoccus albus TaxID=418756 RepID=UPI000375B89B|nr:hypothetical protein [Salinicoccus albus]